MPSRRMERIAEAIRQSTSETILYKLKDPRCGFVTISRVEVAKDLRHARIYISVLGEEATQRTTLRGLQSARGFIQTELARRLTTRFTPQITFELDDSPARSVEISQLIDKAIAEDESRHPRPDDDMESDPETEQTSPEE